VSRFPDSPSNEQMIVMIDELLSEMFGDAKTSAGHASGGSSGTGGAPKDGSDVSSPGWRRLA
jgi:hypothetical protein